MKNLRLILFFLIVLFNSCAIDDDIQTQACEDVEIGNIDILETSISAIPYFQLPATSVLVFVNENGDEANFILRNRSTTFIQRDRSRPCDNNQDSNHIVSGQLKEEKIELFCEELDFHFRFILFPNISMDDICPIKVSDNLTVVYRRESVVHQFIFHQQTIDKRDFDNPLSDPDCFSSIEVIDILLEDVCKSENRDGTYWNQEMGIVAFVDSYTTVQWVLDRIE